MSANVLLTVLMPVRNGGGLLREAVQSIRLQTYSHWELLILDDGSDDDALTGIAALQDERVRIVRDAQRQGIAVRLNQGVAMARGDIIARMDGDDVCFPERFARQLALLRADPGLDLVGVSAATINAQGELTGLLPGALTHLQLCARPWRSFYLAHPGWMGRAEWFRAHPYAEPGPHGCEDQELLLRTYAHSRFACTPEVLLAYRTREATDWAALGRTRRAWWQCQRRYFWRTRQLRYLFLAGSVHLLRRGRDALARWRRWSILRPRPVPANLLAQWQELRGRLPD